MVSGRTIAAHDVLRWSSVVGMSTQAMMRLAMLLVLTGIVSACGAAESEPPRAAPAPGELDAVRIEVHEAPG